MYTTENGDMVGERMKRAVEYVSRNGAYQSKNALAESVGVNGSTQYGYRNVNRCIKKNLLTINREDYDDLPNGSMGAVEITDKGEKFLENL
jgi:hypothetical protein